MPVTVAEMLDYVRSEFGAPVIEVELTDTHIRNAIDDALHELNRYLPRHVRGSISVSQPVQRYLVDVPAAIDVIDLEFLNRTQMSLTEAIENPFVLDRTIREGASASEYTGFLTDRRNVQRVFSADPEWRSSWEVEGGVRKLYCYIYVPQFTPYWASYTVAARYTLDDDLTTGLPAIPGDAEIWFRQYVLAVSRIILGGRIYDKFKGIPSPDGSDMNLNGDEMKAEGLEAKQALIEEIRQMRRQIPFSW